VADPLEALLRPVANILNRNIVQVTPARELCTKLDGKTVAIRVRDTGLAMYFIIDEELIRLTSDIADEPDVVICGSLLTLASMLRSADEAAIRDGDLDLTGDARTAMLFQELLGYAKPDVEEELSTLIGDAAAHRLGVIARDVGRWARGARSTMGANVREYLQEENRSLPSRYEVERFTTRLQTLRDDVERLDARLRQLEGDS
jgi:ubiquinone biosynthesis protein UbiJ